MTLQQILPIVIPIAVLAIILIRNRRPRPLNLHLIWIVPLLVIVGIGMGLYFTPHEPFGVWAYAGFAFALILGGVAGCGGGGPSTSTGTPRAAGLWPSRRHWG